MIEDKGNGCGRVLWSRHSGFQQREGRFDSADVVAISAQLVANFLSVMLNEDHPDCVYFHLAPSSELLRAATTAHNHRQFTHTELPVTCTACTPSQTLRPAYFSLGHRYEHFKSYHHMTAVDALRLTGSLEAHPKK